MPDDQGPAFFDDKQGFPLNTWHKVYFERMTKTQKGNGVVLRGVRTERKGVEGTAVPGASAAVLWLPIRVAEQSKGQSPFMLMNDGKAYAVKADLTGAKSLGISEPGEGSTGRRGGRGGGYVEPVSLAEFDAALTWCIMRGEKEGYKRGRPDMNEWVKAVLPVESMMVRRKEWSAPEDWGEQEQPEPAVTEDEIPWDEESETGDDDIAFGG
jgi:hypothetical protein